VALADERYGILSPYLSPYRRHLRRPTAVRFAHRNQRGTCGSQRPESGMRHHLTHSGPIRAWDRAFRLPGGSADPGAASGGERGVQLGERLEPALLTGGDQVLREPLADLESSPFLTLVVELEPDPRLERLEAPG
jgi:hypothetical protein